MVLEFCHDIVMRKTKRLQDVYRFPGFAPCSTLKGVFGDHRALVIQLRRRQKKQCAARAAPFTTVTMTNVLDKFATWGAATDGSTLLTKEGGSIARVVRL